MRRCLGFRVWNLELGEGLVFGVHGLGFEVQSRGLGLGCGVWGLGFWDMYMYTAA